MLAVRLHAVSSTVFLAAAAVACGCGGKLLGAGEDGGANGSSSECDDGNASFSGTWTCSMTGSQTSGGGSDPPSTVEYAFSQSDDGGVTVTFGAQDAAATCTSIALVTSGSTATVAGEPVCFYAPTNSYTTLTSGTFSVSGCSATISNLVGEVRANAGTPTETDYVDTTNGSCTRD